MVEATSKAAAQSFGCSVILNHTQPLSLVDHALIMGLAVFFERETGHSWSITHRPTQAFWACFPVEPLPSPDDINAFLDAVQEKVQRGITRFSKEMPGELAVAERIRPPLEGLLGWHGYWSEDGSYNSAAHTSVEQTSNERFSEKTRDTESYNPDVRRKPPNAALKSAKQPDPQPSSLKAPPKLAKQPDLQPSSLKAPNNGVRKSYIPNGTAIPVEYTELHSRKDAAAALGHAIAPTCSGIATRNGLDISLGRLQWNRGGNGWAIQHLWTCLQWNSEEDQAPLQLLIGPK
ncbi:hypothetical protein BT96DRAFT_939744 [Gymnopus androsaceus JB14]|uniref:Uncharacterized protein n=1 Tax=Gymnopus androsaceus JB14 TaxID=1447944 RepID=A0A6A4HLP3_9AGAR|nr:hypothetical protein BT96DRAFT_939744 [Gymnopus androsaceus JB14]